MKRINSKSILLLLSILITGCYVGCDSNKLTRKKAEEMIRKTNAFPETVTCKLALGCYRLTVFTGNNLTDFDGFLHELIRKKLIASILHPGNFRVEYPVLSSNKRESVFLVAYDLTNEGQKYLINKKFDNRYDEIFYKIKDNGCLTEEQYKKQPQNYIIESKCTYYLGIIRLGEKFFGEVTGIFFSDDNKKARVEYTWGYGALTPFGKIYLDHKEYRTFFSQHELVPSIELLDNNLHKGFINMYLYDDGWRIAVND